MAFPRTWSKVVVKSKDDGRMKSCGIAVATLIRIVLKSFVRTWFAKMMIALQS
ncbi:MAG: hypothetical protein ACTS42_00170 [Candidatus Hodgkinia cicadicola]